MYTSDSFKPLLNRLVQTPEYFTAEDLKEALNHLFAPNVLQSSQVGAFLTALHVHRVERRPESLVAAAQVLRERALKADVQNTEDDFIVDIVGTGGDGYNLFNVSTTAAIVAAGAGARVIKVRFSNVSEYLIFDLVHSTAVAHRPPCQGLPIFWSHWAATSRHHNPEVLHLYLVYHSHSFSHHTTTPRWRSLHLSGKPCHSVRCLMSSDLSSTPLDRGEWSWA